jgi:hypothetical protein
MQCHHELVNPHRKRGAIRTVIWRQTVWEIPSAASSGDRDLDKRLCTTGPDISSSFRENASSNLLSKTDESAVTDPRYETQGFGGADDQSKCVMRSKSAKVFIKLAMPCSVVFLKNVNDHVL